MSTDDKNNVPWKTGIFKASGTATSTPTSKASPQTPSSKIHFSALKNPFASPSNAYNHRATCTPGSFGVALSCRQSRSLEEVCAALPSVDSPDQVLPSTHASRISQCEKACLWSPHYRAAMFPVNIDDSEIARQETAKAALILSKRMCPGCDVRFLSGVAHQCDCDKHVEGFFNNLETEGPLSLSSPPSAAKSAEMSPIGSPANFVSQRTESIVDIDSFGNMRQRRRRKLPACQEDDEDDNNSLCGGDRVTGLATSLAASAYNVANFESYVAADEVWASQLQSGRIDAELDVVVSSYQVNSSDALVFTPKRPQMFARTRSFGALSPIVHSSHRAPLLHDVESAPIIHRHSPADSPIAAEPIDSPIEDDAGNTSFGLLADFGLCTNFESSSITPIPEIVLRKASVVASGYVDEEDDEEYSQTLGVDGGSVVLSSTLKIVSGTGDTSSGYHSKSYSSSLTQP